MFVAVLTCSEVQQNREEPQGEFLSPVRGPTGQCPFHGCLEDNYSVDKQLILRQDFVQKIPAHAETFPNPLWTKTQGGG